MEQSMYIFKFSTQWQTLLLSDCAKFSHQLSIYESSNITSSFKKYCSQFFFKLQSIISVHLSSGPDTFLGFLHSSLEISSSDFLNLIIVLNSKMSICFLFIISSFHLRFTILSSFITSTFSFVILITLHLHSFVIIPLSGISVYFLFSFGSNTIFSWFLLVLSNLGVYPGHEKTLYGENLDSVIFFWKALSVYK